MTAATYPAKDFQGLIAHLKKRKGQTSFASFGTGTASHYAGLILSDEAELGVQHVGYPARRPRSGTCSGARSTYMFDSMLTSMPLIKGGKLRALCLRRQDRSRYLPDVPTMAELGYPDIQFQAAGRLHRLQQAAGRRAGEAPGRHQEGRQAPAVQQKLTDVGLEPELSVDTPAMLRENKVDVRAQRRHRQEIQHPGELTAITHPEGDCK